MHVIHGQLSHENWVIITIAIKKLGISFIAPLIKGGRGDYSSITKSHLLVSPASSLTKGGFLSPLWRGIKGVPEIKPPLPLLTKEGYSSIEFSFVTISFIVVSKSFSIGRLNHAAWICHPHPNFWDNVAMSVFFDLIEHFILSQSFLIVITIFGHLISWITVSQYPACSLSIQWSFSSSIS